jgi:hypothetical protein
MSTPTIEAVDTVTIKRLIAFASDVSQLANQRPDLELRQVIDALYADLIDLKEER